MSSESASSLNEDRLRRLIEAGRSVVAERELEGVFDRLLAVARELTGAHFAAIGVLDDGRETLTDFITSGIDADNRREIGALPRGRGVLGLLISKPEPLRLAHVSEHVRSYGFPAGHPTMSSFLGVPILIRGEAWGNLYLTDKNSGEPFDDSDEEAAVVLAAWAAIAVENARLYRETDQRREDLERSVRALEATSEIARAVGGETQLERVLELIAKRSRALVEASGVVILLTRGDKLEVAAIAGNLPRRILGARVAQSQSVAGRVITAGRSERVSDVANSLRFALGELGVEATAAMFVPLQYRGSTLGVIEAFDRFGGPEFRLEDERMLLAAAASAATAVATAQSVERDRLRRTLNAAEEERRRWARELHDETLQALGGLRVLLSSASRSHDADTLHSAVRGAIEQIGIEINNLRALITELRPAALDELGLGPALDTLFERTRIAHGLVVDAVVQLEFERGHTTERLSTDLETTIYRVVQEGLSNAAEHAHAERIEVEVLGEPNELRLSISDDGRGFDSSSPAAGFGLVGIRERIGMVGGQLDVSSSSTGTKLSARIPLPTTVRQSA